MEHQDVVPRRFGLRDSGFFRPSAFVLRISGRPELCCPEGTSENSPAFQRWVGRQKVASPEGTAEIQSHNPSLSFSRPFGTCMPCRMFPGVKTPGYSQDVPPGQRNVAAAFSDEQATFVMPKA